MTQFKWVGDALSHGNFMYSQSGSSSYGHTWFSDFGGNYD